MLTAFQVNSIRIPGNILMQRPGIEIFPKSGFSAMTQRNALTKDQVYSRGTFSALISPGIYSR